MDNSFFKLLESISSKPDPFAYDTVLELWDNDHTSKQMLQYHLSNDVDMSSRRGSFIERSVKWMVDHFAIDSHTKIADFGCGPGLYATPLARAGAHVTGIDFSRRSIAYARETARQQNLDISYHRGNYLDFETDERFDLILMIMCDFCALSPQKRHYLLDTFRRLLRPDGALILDVYSTVAFDQKSETSTLQKGLLDGFWSPNPYYGFLNTFKYEKEKVVLDKYTIVEAGKTRTVYNWLEHFTPEKLEQECNRSGFGIDTLLSDVAGAPFDAQSSEFAIIARAR
ncbi:class I SAM-dependent methyltransferase [Desulfovibrio inopinatus]|uniref:class I SAM-dependent methyltransferase n=1 Tax=Desulfovibrio inopinatus TaxID=102109 RepID=UPI000404DCE9|nr:class I SAM-dependent methyltransferase [Desulfovibrio inopinatus]